MISIIKRSLLLFPWIKDYYGFRQSLTNHVPTIDYVRFKLFNKLRGGGVYWPIHRTTEVTHPNNIFVGINSNAGTRPGCYLQGNGGIYIGNYVHFASNIGVISGNHDLYDQTKHINEEVRIGDYTWIGMNVVILPGVVLGPRTIVGAGSVVTRSFPDGYCVIAGNPARLIKELDKDKFIPTQFKSEYFGFVPKNKFMSFANKRLKNNKYYPFTDIIG